MFKRLLPLILLHLPLYSMAQSGRFTCATMNVDGLPPFISLGSISIPVNPDAKEERGAQAIAAKVRAMGLDFLGVNEDFNYHTALMSPLTPAGYTACTHSGGMSLKEGGGLIVAIRNYFAKQPLSKADGLNIICRTTSPDGWPASTADGEEIVAWRDAYGYKDHDNDAMTKKGFRYYSVTTADGDNRCDLDVYILHMDAGSAANDGDKGDMEARKKQMAQLLSHIEKKVSNRPIIIMGDFNCYYTRDRLKELFIDPLEQMGDGQLLTVSDCWVESTLDGVYPACDDGEGGYGARGGEVLDKILYVNNARSSVQLVLEQFCVGYDFLDTDGTPLSDHYPAIAQFAFYPSGTLPTVGAVAHTIGDVQQGRARLSHLDKEVNRSLGR